MCVCLCLCLSIFLALPSISTGCLCLVNFKWLSGLLNDRPSSPKVRLSPSDSESAKRRPITSVHVNFLLVISFKIVLNPVIPLQLTSSVANYLRFLINKFEWDFLEHFALKHDVIVLSGRSMGCLPTSGGEYI